MYSEMEPEEKKTAKELPHFFHRRTKRLLNPVGNRFEFFLNTFVIYSFFFLVLGIFSAMGSLSNQLISIFLGILFLGYGGVHFYFFFQRQQLSFYKLSCVYGILGICLGIASFIFANTNYLQLLVVFGIYFIIQTLERVLEGFSLIRLHDKDVIVFLVQSLLFVFMAILLFINPFVNLYFGEIIGIFSILFGILNLSSLSFMRKKQENILSFFD